MDFLIEDEKTLKNIYLVGFPEELELKAPEVITSGDMKFISSMSSNIYDYYQSVYPEVGNFDQVTITPVKEVPYGAKKLRYQA